MTNYIRITFIFLCLFHCAITEEVEIPVSSSLASTEGIFNSIVNEHVCVITGDFVDSAIDLVVPGPEPLAVRRSYTSSDMFYENFLRMGWKLGEPDILVAKMAIGGTIASAKTAHGARVKYYGHIKNNANYPVEFVLNNTPGATNCHGGQISGKTNIKNNRLVVNKNTSHFTATLTDSMGYEKKYAVPKINDIILHFSLHEEKSRHGTLKIFEYGQNNLKVITKNKNRTLQYGSLFYEGHKKTIHVNSSTNDQIQFTFEKFKYRKNGTKTEADFLSEVQSTQKLPVKYEYTRSSNDHPIICNISVQNRKMTEIEYYQSGKNEVGDRFVEKKESLKCIDRVKVLKTRSANGNLAIVNRFFYHLEDGTKKGWTEVLDAHNARTDYFYNNDQRLEYIIKHHDGRRYLRETFTWGPNGSVDEGNLAGKYIQEEGGPYRSGKVFYYDTKGNVTALREYNFVNGHNGPELSIDRDGKPHSHNQAEYYLHTYTYDQNTNLMLSEHEGNGKNVFYKYLPDTDLIASKILVYGDNKFLLREFYDYDENLFLYRKVVDDGTSYDRHNHTGVTCMKVTYIKPRMSAPFGVPEQIDEMYRDCKSGTEYLLHRVINHHLPNGQLVRQDHYDSQDQKLYSLEWEYNPHGLVTKEINALGQVVEKSYDEYDRLIYQKGPSPDFHLTFVYDEADQLIGKIEHHPDGKFAIHSRYDALGNLISTTNVQGNETQYIYDDLKRVTKIQYPDLTIEEFGYDLFGNVIFKRDRNGYETSSIFNSLGKPLKISHPDGTQESFEYWQEGTLKKAVARDGTYTWYNRDCLGRVLEETHFDANHQVLAKRIFKRNSFGLLEEIDPEGKITHYEYDAAARLIKKTDSHQTVTFEYDTCNRIHKEIHWTNDNEARVTVFTYDLANRVIDELTEDLSGKCYSATATTYNQDTQKTSITFGTQITRTFYNSHQDPYKIIDADGNETRLEYNYFYRNEKDQFVTSITIIDPMGNKTVKIHDVNGLIASESQYNAFGKLLSFSEKTYDPLGNLIFEKIHRVVEGTTKETVSTSWTYNSNKEITSLIEAVGTKDQRHRTYKYNAIGQKIESVKPDGVSLYYAYDSKGRLERIWSSDQTVDYTYAYNRNDQILKVCDRLLNATTRRIYDGERLLSETLGNGLIIEYEYDNINRRVKTILPDRSEINYQYDPVFLREITRANYKHINSNYDENGNLTKCTLPFAAGTLSIEYDNLSRKRKITHPAYTQTIPKNSYDKAGNLLNYKIKGVGTYSFAYDDLYQLITEDDVEKHEYSYDSLNNRLRKDDEISSYNALNQLQKKGLSYDANGNLIKKGNTQFSYDAFNRLIKVITPEKTYSYTYDFDDRRLSKNDEKYLYENQHNIGIYQNNQAKALRILGDTRSAEIGAAIAIELGSQVYIPLHDHNGNVVNLLNPDGSTARSYMYTAFGLQPEPDLSDPNPWRFSSKFYDPETEFIYFGRRYYDPSSGRWITPDPSDYDDGPNLYCYVRNRPLSCIDLFGLECTDITLPRPVYETTENAQVVHDDYFELGRAPSFRRNLGLPEFSTDTRVSYANGMNTSWEKHLETAKIFSEMYGYNIHSVYNATHGVVIDTWECYVGSRFVATKPVRLLHEEWNDFLKNNNNGAYLLQICHSQGAIHVRNALLSYDPELRMRIIVLAIAPGAYIDSKTCAQVIHYKASATRDLIPHLDWAGLARETARGTVVVLPSHPSAPRHDHGIDSKTYQRVIREAISNYKKSGGKEI